MARKDIGPGGQIREGDTVQQAMQGMRILTGREEEQHVSRRRNGGLVGGQRRRENLSPERRSEIARNAALARWRKRDAA